MGQVVAYYKEYAQALGLSDNIHRNTKVTKIKREGDSWEIYASHEGKETIHTSEVVIVACGIYDIPRRLGVKGEGLPFVRHRMPSSQDEIKGRVVLVVGNGITAGDCVHAALKAQCHVHHIFRTKRTDGLGLSRFYENNKYGIYADLVKKMTGEKRDKRYHPKPDGQIQEIREDGFCIIEFQVGEKRLKQHIRMDAVWILIGSQSDFSFLDESLQERIQGQKGKYPFMVAENLFIIGAANDVNFVQNFVPGCLAAAHEARCAIKTIPKIDRTLVSKEVS